MSSFSRACARAGIEASRRAASTMPARSMRAAYARRRSQESLLVQLQLGQLRRATEGARRQRHEQLLLPEQLLRQPLVGAEGERDRRLGGLRLPVEQAQNRRRKAELALLRRVEQQRDLEGGGLDAAHPELQMALRDRAETVRMRDELETARRRAEEVRDRRRVGA